MLILLLALLGILIILVAIRCIRIVPEATCQIIEFLGKYQATWNSGVHFKIPVLQRIVRKVSLKEQVADFDPQSVITKDNVTMKIDTLCCDKED